MILEFRSQAKATKCLRKVRVTFVERAVAFLFENAFEAVQNSHVLGVEEWLVDQSNLDNLKGLHHEDLSPPRDATADEAAEKIKSFSHFLSCKDVQ